MYQTLEILMLESKNSKIFHDLQLEKQKDVNFVVCFLTAQQHMKAISATNTAQYTR